MLTNDFNIFKFVTRLKGQNQSTSAEARAGYLYFRVLLNPITRIFEVIINTSATISLRR